MRDRIPAELHLYEHLDDAGERDQPEQTEARLGAQAVVLISSPVPTIEAARIKPGPDLPDRPGERMRRLLDGLGGKCVQIAGLVVHLAPADEQYQESGSPARRRNQVVFQSGHTKITIIMDAPEGECQASL